jgi:uncharacterized protein (TIGR02596 family)
MKFLPHRFSQPRRAGAFSLVELLFVIVIMAILVALAIPAVQGVMSSRDLGDAGGIITTQLQAARQAAVTRNAAVQLQILKVVDIRTGDPSAFRVVRTLIMEQGSREWRPLGRHEWLPEGTWVDEATDKSPMLSQQVSVTNLPAGISPSAAVGAWLMFDGSGGASVDNSSNWITIASRSNTNDFLTVQIEPVSGRVRTFRPGL